MPCGANRTRPPRDVPPDAGDRHLWELLARERGEVLVTGDRLLMETRLPLVPSSARRTAWPGLLATAADRDARAVAVRTAPYTAAAALSRLYPLPGLGAAVDAMDARREAFA